MSTIWLRWRRSALTAPTILALFACGGTVQVEDLVPDADGFYTTRSGLRFQILAEGEGPKPKEGDTVRLHYSTARPDGTVIDSSFERGEPDVMALRDVVRGFREALKLMPVGSRYKVLVPGKLAYGREGIPGLVGPNETLTFIIHLHEIAPQWIPLSICFNAMSTCRRDRGRNERDFMGRHRSSADGLRAIDGGQPGTRVGLSEPR